MTSTNLSTPGLSLSHFGSPVSFLDIRQLPRSVAYLSSIIRKLHEVKLFPLITWGWINLDKSCLACSHFLLATIQAKRHRDWPTFNLNQGWTTSRNSPLLRETVQPWIREECSNESHALFAAREILPQWDKQIQSLCYQVNSLIEKIAAAEPDWMAKLMEEEMIQW